ncbi:sensor histidine kinase [Paenibacillus favisporus]|uniref:sensor histidine kinase n=1 Tax=Paenibacillus favisporus TaxID=221028 RepID=UPI0013D23275|nr:HAMP domain-containing sensor histidine kinase [Paenibacillus favisporus]
MKTLRIRTFTILCLFMITLVPWVFFVAANFLETHSLKIGSNQPYDESLQKDLNEAIHMIEMGSGRWRDPNWQGQLQSELRQTKLDAVILSDSDEEIYRSTEREGGLRSTERFSVIENGHLLGRVVLYLPKSNTLRMISAFAGLLLAFFIVGVEMRRFLLKPLEKMSRAARQIASGDWEVRLPKSRITEIAEVGDGFDVMVKGLRTSYRKQVELEEERRFVISAVAHDLRTPLFALRGYLDGLEQGIAQTPEKISKYVAVCKEKSAQLDRLVEDLFTFTKMEYWDRPLNKAPIDLPVVFQQSIDSLSPGAGHKSIVINSHLAADCIVSGDAHLLERALSNLLDNAVRHTPQGGTVDVRCNKEEGKIAFMIRDSGPGFTAEELERVFEPLYRGEASRNRSTGGSGLGLTISQRIIRQHGGELKASNDPEGGARLTGWIPAADSHIS